MKIKLLLFTFLFIGGFSFQNCSDDDFDCDFSGPIFEYFDIQDTNLEHIHTGTLVNDEVQLTFEEYEFLMLNFEVEYVAAIIPTPFNFGFLNSLHACSPPEPGTKGAKTESFESFELITVNDFDELHLAGQSINDLFEIDFSMMYTPELDIEGDIISLNKFLEDYDVNVPSEYFFLKLQSEPVLNKSFQVKAMITLSNGEVYEATSQVVTFM